MYEIVSPETQAMLDKMTNDLAEMVLRIVEKNLVDYKPISSALMRAIQEDAIQAH